MGYYGAERKGEGSINTYTKEGNKFSFYRDGKLIYSVENPTSDFEDFIKRCGIQERIKS